MLLPMVNLVNVVTWGSLLVVNLYRLFLGREGAI